MTIQRGTPECKNNIKTDEDISKHKTTQNGTPECKNNIKTDDDISKHIKKY